MGYICAAIIFAITGSVIGICFKLMGIDEEKVNKLFNIN